MTINNNYNYNNNNNNTSNNVNMIEYVHFAHFFSEAPVTPVLQYLRHAGQHLEPCKIYLQTWHVDMSSQRWQINQTASKNPTAKPHPTATNLPTSLEHQGKTQGWRKAWTRTQQRWHRSAVGCHVPWGICLGHGPFSWSDGGAGDGKHAMFVSQTESKFQEHDEGWSLKFTDSNSTCKTRHQHSRWHPIKASDPGVRVWVELVMLTTIPAWQIKATQEFAAWCSPSLPCKDLLPGTSWHPVMLSGPFYAAPGCGAFHEATRVQSTKSAERSMTCALYSHDSLHGW